MIYLSTSHGVLANKHLGKEHEHEGDYMLLTLVAASSFKIFMPRNYINIRLYMIVCSGWSKAETERVQVLCPKLAGCSRA